MGIFKKPVTCSSNKGATRGVEEEMEDFVNSFSSFSQLVKELSGEEQEQFKAIFNGVIEGVGTKMLEAEDKDQMGEIIAEVTKDDQELLLQKMKEENILAN